MKTKYIIESMEELIQCTEQVKDGEIKKHFLNKPLIEVNLKTGTIKLKGSHSATYNLSRVSTLSDLINAMAKKCNIDIEYFKGD